MSDKTKLEHQKDISVDEFFDIPPIAQEEDIPPNSREIRLEAPLPSGRVKKYEEQHRPNRIWESKGFYTFIMSFGLALYLIGAITATFFDNPSPALAVLLIFSFFTFIVGFYLRARNRPSNRKTSEYRDYLTLKLESPPIQSLAQSKDDNASKKDIIALMLKNNDETTEYFSISKRQAKISYCFSIIACAVGIVILIASIIAACFKHTDVAIITVIAGAITEVIAGTVLWVHNKSALQLNHYYKALHENEKFLSAITLAERVSDSRRDDIYCEIIKRQLDIDK